MEVVMVWYQELLRLEYDCQIGMHSWVLSEQLGTLSGS
jgi:hypothetical protein